MNRDNSSANQGMDLASICRTLGVAEATPADANMAYVKAFKSVERMLMAGITAWTIENDLGISALYSFDSSGTAFIATRQIIYGRPVSQSITGAYKINGNKVTVQVDCEIGSANLSYYTFNNSRLIASKTNSDTFVGANLTQLIQQLTADISKTPILPAEPVQNSHLLLLGLAEKMLNDFAGSQLDGQTTERMFSMMSRKEYKIVRNRSDRY